MLYSSFAQDPDTLEAIPDPTWSDAMYFAVDCGDYAYGSGSATERADAYVAAGQAAGVDDLRLGSGYYIDYPCAWWPAHGPQERPAYLTDHDYPVFILGATWDPYTPFPNAERLAQNIPDSYFIVQPGGPHVIYLRGESCPDDDISAYLLDGTLPASHRIDCDFLGADDYVPIPAQDASDYGSTRAALSAVDDEINTNTEWEYWDGEHILQVGCMKGGTISYEANAQGYQVTLDDCAFGRAGADRLGRDRRRRHVHARCDDRWRLAPDLSPRRGGRSHLHRGAGFVSAAPPPRPRSHGRPPCRPASTSIPPCSRPSGTPSSTGPGSSSRGART